MPEKEVWGQLDNLSRYLISNVKVLGGQHMVMCGSMRINERRLVRCDHI